MLSVVMELEVIGAIGTQTSRLGPLRFRKSTMTAIGNEGGY